MKFERREEGGVFRENKGKERERGREEIDVLYTRQEKIGGGGGKDIGRMRRGDRSRETDKYGKGKEEYGEEKKKKYLIMERDEIEIKKRKMFDERGVDEGRK